MKLKFHKYMVAGNDFVLIDGRQQRYPIDPEFYRRIGDRHRGIGYDQALLIIEPQDLEAVASTLGLTLGKPSPSGLNRIQVAYLVFNADGSRSEQCGNGLCGIGHYLSQSDQGSKKTLRSISRVVTTELLEDDEVLSDLGHPDFDPKSLPYIGPHQEGVGTFQLRSGNRLKFYLVSIANPHVVIFLARNEKDILEQLDVVGASFNDNEHFPQGVNVSLVYPETKNTALIRVYERGVGPTLACGSASCATMACARRWFGVGESLNLKHPGGALRVQWASDDQPIYLRAPVEHVFSGQLEY